MGRRRVDELGLDSINLALDEVWERVEKVEAQAVSGELSEDQPRNVSSPVLWIDRISGQLKVQYPDGTIDTFSKDP